MALPPRTGPVVLPVCALAIGVVGVALWDGAGELIGPAVVFLVAATLAEAFPVPIEGVTAGATSFANVFIVAAAVLYGWRAAVVIGALSMLLVEFWRRMPVVRLVYNSALYALGAAAAALVVRPFSEPYRNGLLGSLAFYVVDVALLAAVLARVRREPYLPVAGSFFKSTMAPFTVMAATSAILVELWRDSPYWGLLLLPPLMTIAMYERSLLATVQRQRELDKLKDEFIAVISHELRTPLSSVYGAAVTLEERALDEEMSRRLINVIRRESARLAKVVSDVLWASRLEAKKTNSQPGHCDAAALAQEVTHTGAEIAPDNLSIVAKASGSPVGVQADAEHLRVVLANLVDNATKYSPEGGTVEIRTEQQDGHVRFTISDEGIGIPEGDRERIFEKFTRLDPEMHRGISGTGLGLYICRELVDQMGGTISVRDNQPQGTTFILELPASTEREGQ